MDTLTPTPVRALPSLNRLGAFTYGSTQLVALFWWAAFYPGTLLSLIHI